MNPKNTHRTLVLALIAPVALAGAATFACGGKDDRPAASPGDATSSSGGMDHSKMAMDGGMDHPMTDGGMHH